jgi:hypothetical protein
MNAEATLFLKENVRTNKNPVFDWGFGYEFPNPQVNENDRWIHG